MDKILLSIPIKKVLTEKEFIPFIQQLQQAVDYAKDNKKIQTGMRKIGKAINDYKT